VPLDIFFTFPVLETNEQRVVLVRWCVNVRLKGNIEALVQQNPQTNEAELVRNFIDAIQQFPPVDIARSHLVAFLSNFSYRSAARIKYELEQLNYLSSDIYGFLQDLFQTAFEVALDPLDFFKNFKVEKSQAVFWYFSLKGYTRRKMEGLLRDKVRTIEGFTTYGRTDLGLAARSSEKRVISALRALGEPKPKIMSFVLAWKCFQEARTAKVIQVDSSKPEHFQAIAQRYNYLKSKYPEPLHPSLDGPTLEQWLKTIGAAVRRYCDRPVQSLDVLAYKSGGETTQGGLLVDEGTVSEINTLSSPEIQTELGALKQLIETVLQESDSEIRQIFLFKYGLQLSQMQIGAELKKHQSSVSRTQQKFEEGLIKKFSQTFNPRASSIDHETLLALRDYLNEYWQNYYADLIHHFFQQSSRTLRAQREISQTLSQSQLRLLEDLTLRVEDYGQFTLTLECAARQKLSKMVEQWLHTKTFMF
jgi:RNA polymerase sigma factor (sigma-70 family)